MNRRALLEYWNLYIRIMSHDIMSELVFQLELSGGQGSPVISRRLVLWLKSLNAHSRFGRAGDLLKQSGNFSAESRVNNMYRR